MTSLSVLYRGSETEPSQPRFVRAGPLTARFEPDGVFLRHVRLGETEILRGIYVAVRDRNWDTILPSVGSIQIDSQDDSFKIEVQVDCREREIDFSWRGIISGDPNGTIRYQMSGVARSSFHRNRIGILVLHPPKECAGQPCRIEHSDGVIEETAFPDLISPHQPFFDIRTMTHQVREGLDAEIRFEGDIFETEDQRNWTDASFKTYSTPLELPFPVLIEEGTEIEQSIELRFNGDLPESDEARHSGSVRIAASGANAVPVPPIGLSISSTEPDLSERQTERLRAIKPGHLRVDLRVSDPDLDQHVERAWRQSEALEIPLQPALHVSAGEQMLVRQVVEQLAQREAFIAEWLIFNREEKVAGSELVKEALSEIITCDPEAIIASGTNAYFTELNRERPDTSLLDALCYSINPQVHAFDDLSLMETLEAQAWTVTSARSFADGRKIIVGPVTLRPRFNPNATDSKTEPEPDSVPSSVDPRQMSLLGAGWTLGSLKYLSESEIDNGTWYETVGWRGVMERESGSLHPDGFPTQPDSVFPLYHVLADFGDFLGGEIIPWRSNDPLLVDGCFLQRDGESALLLANLSPEEQEVEIEWPGEPSKLSMRLLDETTAEQAMTDPETFRSGTGACIEVNDGVAKLTLKPFAYARISEIPLN